MLTAPAQAHQGAAHLGAGARVPLQGWGWGSSPPAGGKGRGKHSFSPCNPYPLGHHLSPRAHSSCLAEARAPSLAREAQGCPGLWGMGREASPTGWQWQGRDGATSGGPAEQETQLHLLTSLPGGHQHCHAHPPKTLGSPCSAPAAFPGTTVTLSPERGPAWVQDRLPLPSHDQAAAARPPFLPTAAPAPVQSLHYQFL